MREKWNCIFLHQHAGGDTNKQLENNTTKNLLLTLRDTDNSFTKQLLSTGFRGMDWEGYEIEEVDTQASLNSDKVIDALEDGTKGFLLGISRYGKSVATEGEPTRNANSTIDGLVVLRNSRGQERLVGIEVKTYSDKLESGQMGKYRRQLQIPLEENHSRLGTVSWGEVYETVNNHARREGADNVAPRKLSKDGYLWNEFAKSLRNDQLEITIAQNNSTPYKRLWMRPANSQAKGNGDYEVTLTWENTDNVTKSRLGWIGIDAFEELLAQLPLGVRMAAFGKGEVSYQRFLDELYTTEKYADIEDGANKNLSRTELPDGSERAFRMKWITDENDDKIVSNRPHFRVVKYYASGKYAQGASPNLDPEAFEELFGSIPVETRRDALVGDPNPDMSQLWKQLIHEENQFQDPRES